MLLDSPTLEKTNVLSIEQIDKSTLEANTEKAIDFNQVTEIKPVRFSYPTNGLYGLL